MLDTAIEQETSIIMFFDNNISGTDWRIRQLEKKIDLILIMCLIGWIVKMFISLNIFYKFCFQLFS